MRKYLYQIIFFVLVFGSIFCLIFYFTSNRLRKEVTKSCLLSICQAFLDNNTISLDYQSFGTEWKILEEKERLELLSELKSKHCLDCGKALKENYRDLWNSPIILGIRRESDSSKVFFLQVRSAGRDRKNHSKDDIFCEVKLE